MNRRNHSVTLQQAAQESPTFAHLATLALESSERLKSIQALIPAALRCTVKAGPIDGEVWCLILDSNAAAAKIRQLLPCFESHLRTKGWNVNSIRLKIQTQKPTGEELTEKWCRLSDSN
ncbi:MAG: hypothetical protein IPH37_00530 [Burkholderiales bacterium]|nr:hypothetical protein [Burkholderiales bacterium]